MGRKFSSDVQSLLSAARSYVECCFEVIPDSCKSNNLFVLVGGIKCNNETNSTLKQLQVAHLSNHYGISGGNHQLKFCLYSQDSRLRVSNLEVYKVLIDVEPDVITYNGNDCAKVGDENVEQFHSAKIQNSTITNRSSSELTYCDKKGNSISNYSTRNDSTQERHQKNLSYYAGDCILLVNSMYLKE
ncbi:unnamed protein product [Trichobilharzia szidati]|nr:unnamed protein product [Trichobilharzia szidati]